MNSSSTPLPPPPELPLRKFTLQQSPIDIRDHLHVTRPSLKAAILPQIVDLRPQMCPVLDQGDLGSCSANAMSIVLRHLLLKGNKKQFQPSRLFIYYNTRVKIAKGDPNEDSGACLRDVCKAVQTCYACDELLWPYITSRFNIAPNAVATKNAAIHNQIQYAAVTQTVKALQEALATNFTVIFGVAVYDSFIAPQTIKTGIIPMPDTENEVCQGGHALVLVGYNNNTQRFLVQNSWGKGIGVRGSGCFEIPYAYITNPNLAFDFWVIKYFA
jgi:C1A family cysteine protease